jgi:hypothetical protein
MLLPAMVWIGAGAWMLGLWLAGTGQALRRRPLTPAVQRALLAAPALLLAALLLALGPQLWRTMQRTHSFQPGHLAAAAALHELGAPADAVVMSRYPAIAFHAGTRWAATPAEEWPAVLAYARQHGARYLALDGWEAHLRPQLSFLLDPGQAPPELRHLATVAGRGSGGALRDSAMTGQAAAPAGRPPRRIDWALLAIVLAGLAVRGAFISLPRMARWDEASYLTIASNLLAGRGYSELMGACQTCISRPWSACWPPAGWP